MSVHLILTYHAEERNASPHTVSSLLLSFPSLCRGFDSLRSLFGNCKPDLDLAIWVGFFVVASVPQDVPFSRLHFRLGFLAGLGKCRLGGDISLVCRCSGVPCIVPQIVPGVRFLFLRGAS